MKQIIISLAFIVSFIMNATAANLISLDGESSRIEFVKENISGQPSDHHDFSRSINSTELIEGVVYKSEMQIELILNNIGETDIYILNSLGQVINSEYAVDTTILTTIQIPINVSGSYSIVIISDTCYAEGYFTL